MVIHRQTTWSTIVKNMVNNHQNTWSKSRILAQRAHFNIPIFMCLNPLFNDTTLSDDVWQCVSYTLTMFFVYCDHIVLYISAHVDQIFSYIPISWCAQLICWTIFVVAEVGLLAPLPSPSATSSQLATRNPCLYVLVWLLKSGCLYPTINSDSTYC
jgi:hypothetical protein